ncbi:fibroblast growth factor receptor 3-like [Saccoglossus kowalevskii]|uniref:Fibroblast growth factor receptor 3-like n=1 Tax=Saccoglossus kowalevskii TaxID=10224 RepID=A0ABM0H0D1_SACKO|nr:PREDICTED: fibroblast growth factor receptor 3-like [Saccoglossus kowalevskii]
MRHNKSKATLLVIVMLAISSSCDSLPLERTIRDSLKGSKPYFTSPQKMSRRFIAEPAGKGVTARFHCHADGNPTPRINWLKNHQEMDASNIRIDKVRIKKWSLILEDLLPSDSGLYTCIVGNQYGSINATYELEVIARVIKIPRLQSGLPKNQTAYIGDSVTFRCQVQSRDSLAPHIQWLKHTSTSNNDVGDAFSLLQREWPKHPEWNCVAMTRNLFEKSPFICIAPETDIGQPPIDPEKLRLTNVTFEDAAEYTCLAGNAIGIARRSAWLTVKRPPGNILFTHPNFMKL